MINIPSLIHPLLLWIKINPNGALLVTFLIAFSESIIILGGLIPGAIIMLSIGIIAGNGLMRIDLTLISAIFGAIFGDTVSYLLGDLCSDHLNDLWPFSKYPSWLNNGKRYFISHGGKSIFIGRFIGPLRAIIPVVAGMMHMRRLHFFAANILSAVAWSVVYILPGIIIGKTGSKLSIADAPYFLKIFLTVIIGAWIVTKIFIWLNYNIRQWMQKNLHALWIKSQRFSLITKLTPDNEKNHYLTAILSITLLACLLITATLITMIFTLDSSKHLITNLMPMNFKISYISHCFNLQSQLISPLFLMILISIVTIYLILHDRNFLRFWLLVLLASTILAICVTDLTAGNKYFINLTLSTTLFATLVHYIKNSNSQLIIICSKIISISMLIISGIAYFYLRNLSILYVLLAYFTGLSVYFAGLIYYRKFN